MKRTSLVDLICPAVSASGPCRGALSVQEDELLVESENETHGVIEGVLRCASCGAWFPILCGLPIVLSDVLTYLRVHFGNIVSTAAVAGVPISANMLRYLEAHGAHRSSTLIVSAVGWHYGSPQSLSMYLSAHYDDVTHTAPAGSPFAAFLQTGREKDPYSTLRTLIAKYLDEGGTMVDIGCNVGRLSRELASRCGKLYSLDINFGVALIARQILTGWPRPFDGYDLYRDGFIIERRAIALPPLSNVDVLIGSGLELPFRDSSLDIAVSANVLDTIPSPAGLLMEKRRTLRVGGLLALASPYYWDMMVPIEGWLGGRDGVPSAEKVRSYLSDSFELLAETDQAPWSLHHFDRMWSFYLTHCLVARKRAKAAIP